MVELFTSQGCSSCPPADALLADLADRDDLLALSFHVDYWDYIGWKDVFASPLYTRRQRSYAQRFRRRYVYTPQMVINGGAEVTGSDRARVFREIARNKRTAQVSMGLSQDAAGRIVVSIPGAAEREDATVWLVAYDREHLTKVTRGENRGRTIRNRNVVRGIQRIGVWRGETLEIPVMLSEVVPDGADSCAVLVQSQRTGRIIGAAKVDLGRAN